MIEQKQNDWVLNLLENPNMSTSDFKAAGLDADNTSLLDENIYKRSNLILNNPLFKKEDGTFDNTKFHNFYLAAQLTYNMLSDETYIDKNRRELTVYGKDDIFAPKNLRKTLLDLISYSKTVNPDRITSGLIRLGEDTKPKYSVEENAQNSKVLLNPVEASLDPSKAKWGPAPNESWFDGFFETRVLAQEEYTDPETGEKKTRLKLNDLGQYYYENLDGRDVYGKTVLNKMNTLTTDGSFWNRYDFFDSDGLELKSIGGSILKNVALVGSMFIPYVGPWIAGVSVATLVTGLLGTLGKMLPGVDNPAFSELEGWAKSVSRQTAKSQYAQENTWCWENFINLIGDVAGLLKEQRFIFEYAPAIIKGNKIINAKGFSQAKLDAFKRSLIEYYDKLSLAKFSDLVTKGLLTPGELNKFLVLTVLNQSKAAKDVENFVNEYLKIGSVLSKGYMTAITVGDTFGEAKYEAGATDTEATLLTLGYAAAEAALLNSDIGQWILPELKASGLKTRKIIEAVTEHKQLAEKLGLNSKLEVAKSWFKKGVDTFRKVMSEGKGLKGLALAGALSEGLEETSEELLADFSKSCFNTVLWLQGDTGRMSAWDNMFDRYTMSLIGGAIGGGVTAVGTNFKEKPKEYTSEQAKLELMYMLRLGKKLEIYKTLDKMTFANPYVLSEVDEETQSNKPANSETGNLDSDIKKAFINYVEMADLMIRTEGLNVSDADFLNAIGDVRFSKLLESPISSLFLLDFNNLTVDIFKTKEEINKLTSSTTDSKPKLSLEDLDRLSLLNNKLLELRTKKDLYLNGEKSMEYLTMALFDLTPEVSSYFTEVFFKDFAESKTGLKFDLIEKSKLDELTKDFENWKSTEYKNRIATIVPIYLLMARNSGQFIQEFALNYDKVRSNLSLQRLILSLLKTDVLNYDIQQVNNINPEQLDGWIGEAKKLFNPMDDILTLIASKADLNVINTINSLINQALTLESEEDRLNAGKLLENILLTTILRNPELYFEDFIKTGAVNPSIKNSLIEIAKNVLKYSNKYLKLNRILRFIDFEAGETLEEILGDELAVIENELLVKHIDNDEKLLDNLIEASNQYKTRLNNIINQLEELSYTDSALFLLDFISRNSDNKINVPELLNTVTLLINLNYTNLEDVNLENSIDDIDSTLKAIKWLKGLVRGALSDPEATLDNFFGFNSTINNLARNHKTLDWIDLPTITVEDSNIITLDLSIIENKLLLAKNLHYINNGKKILLQNRVADNKNFIMYNRLHLFVLNLGDEWEEKLSLLDAIENSKILSLLVPEKKLSGITTQQRKAIEEELKNIDNAIFNFFNNDNNLKFIKEGKLKDLFKNALDVFSIEKLLLNEDTKSLFDHNFVWALAARAAFNKNLFYGAFRKIIDDRIVPLPTLEEAVYLNTAFILNGDMFEQFRQAYAQAIIETFNEADVEKKKLILNRLGISGGGVEYHIEHGINDTSIIPGFSNIILTEGVAGSGKTDAVNYYTIKLLNSIDENITKNMWYSHRTVDSATLKIKEFNLKNTKPLDKNSLMTLVYSKYNTSRTMEDGIYLYSLDEWIRDKDNKFMPNVASDAVSTDNIPSLIIIDEISHYDEYDLKLLDDFAKKHGITILTYGDFSLSSMMSEIRALKSGDPDFIFNLAPTRFIHSTKLGVSMRTSNNQMDKTIASLLEWENTGMDPKKPIKVYSYIGNEGFNGVDVIADGSPKVFNIIQKMVDTKKEGEKIGVIYYKDDAPILKILKDFPLDIFDLKKGSSALGLEGLYYIIDTYGISNDIIAQFRDLNTGITRAKLGALIYGNTFSPIKTLEVYDQQTTITLPSKLALDDYRKNRQELLDTLYKDAPDIEYIPRLKDTTLPEEKPSTNVPPVLAVGTSTKSPIDGYDLIVYQDKTYYTLNGKVYDLVNDKLEEIKDLELINNILGIENVLKLEEPELTTLEESNTEQVVLLTETLNTDSNTKLPKGLYNLIMYSNNTFELGASIKDGKTVLLDSKNPDRYKYRIDSLIGLLKIYEQNWLNPSNDEDYYINRLAFIRNALLNYDSKVDIINAINSLLSEDNINTNVDNIEFGLVSSPYVSKGKEWGYNNISPFTILDKHINEMSIGNITSDKVSRKTVNALITLHNGLRLSIPLFALGNLKSYLVNPTTEESRKLAAIYNKVNGSIVDFHKEVANSSDPDLALFKSIAKLFLYLYAGWFPILDSTWTPSGNMNNLGIWLKTEANSDGHHKYDPSSHTVKHMLDISTGIRASKLIYTTLLPIDINGHISYIANVGHPYILLTTAPDLITDLDMENYYIKQLSDPNIPKKVTLSYIIPPKVSTEEYLRNLYEWEHEKDKNKRNNIKKLGSHLTSYLIWKALLPELENENSYISQKLPETRTVLIEKINYLKLLEEDYNKETNPDEKKVKFLNIINELLSHDLNWKGYNINYIYANLKLFFNYLLLAMFSDVQGNMIEDNLKELSLIISNSGIPYIYYTAKFKDKVPSADLILVPLDSDLDANGNSLYTVNGLPWTVNAKFDYNMFNFKNYRLILDSWAGMIVKDAKYGTYSTKYTNDYVNNALNANTSDSKQYLFDNGYSITFTKDLNLVIVELETNVGTYSQIYPKSDIPNLKLVSLALMESNLNKLIPNLPQSWGKEILNNIYSSYIASIYSGTLFDLKLSLTNLNVQDFNMRLDNSIIYKDFNGLWKVVTFDLDILEQNDLLYTSIDFDGSILSIDGTIILKLNEDTLLTINGINNNVEITKLAKQEESSEEDLGNVEISQYQDKLQLLYPQLWEELVDVYDTVSDIYGDESITELMLNILDNEQNIDPELKKLFEQVVNNSESLDGCSITTKVPF